MDPFSIVAGTAGLIDVSLRVSKRLLKLKDDVASTKNDLDTLLHQINAINTATESIRRAFENEIANNSGGEKSSPSEADKLWQQISANLRNCEKRLCDLEELLKRITGSKDVGELINTDGGRHSNTFDHLKVQLRKIPLNSKFDQIQTDLKGYKDTLTLFLNIIGL